MCHLSKRGHGGTPTRSRNVRALGDGKALADGRDRSGEGCSPRSSNMENGCVKPEKMFAQMSKTSKRELIEPSAMVQ